MEPAVQDRLLLYIHLSRNNLQVLTKQTKTEEHVSALHNGSLPQTVASAATRNWQIRLTPRSLLLRQKTQGWIQGGGAGGPAPLFWQSILFSTLYTMSQKIFLKLNLDFIVAEIRGVFGSVGVYACVWIEIGVTTGFVLQRPYFEWYPRPSWSQKYMPDCRKSHLIFQNFLGRPPPAFAPSALGSGLRPLTAPPLSKIPGSAPETYACPGVFFSSNADFTTPRLCEYATVLL